MSQNQNLSFPQTEVAVALIIRRDLLLTIFNPRWGSFTLPMTKPRRWADPSATRVREEPWIDAAARAAAECLGRTLTEELRLKLDLTQYWQGDATGEVKQYHHQLFEIQVPPDTQFMAGVVGEWLTPSEILDPNRRPISGTARYLVGEWRKGQP